MAMQYRVTRTEVKERYFTCERCGARGEVEFHAVGDGGWVEERHDEDDAAGRSARSAEDDLMVDADRVVGYMRCPACELRRKGAFTGVTLRFTALMVLAIPPPFVHPNLIMFSFIFGLPAFYMLWIELQRLRRADRAVVTKLVYGAQHTVAAKQPAPKPVVPKRAPAPAPVIPVRTSAPEIVQPRGPHDGPAFLE